MSGKVRAEVEREGGEQIRRGKREGKEEKWEEKMKKEIGRKKCKKKGITFRSISIYSGSTVSN